MNDIAGVPNKIPELEKDLVDSKLEEGTITDITAGSYSRNGTESRRTIPSDYKDDTERQWNLPAIRGFLCKKGED